MRMSCQLSYKLLTKLIIVTCNSSTQKLADMYGKYPEFDANCTASFVKNQPDLRQAYYVVCEGNMMQKHSQEEDAGWTMSI